MRSVGGADLTSAGPSEVKVIRTVGGTDLTTAGPSSVIEVVGFRGQPGAGDRILSPTF
ncbi:hypothetical protein T484DRAFT_1795791 [Baffinella frigidus]|nr:hypothetical protein T484DRAFT_1795791 [Cryptophyta sp. CCMP2293]